MGWKFWKKQENKNPAPIPAAVAVVGPNANPLCRKQPANPCLCCGACCAFFLVSFPGIETDNVRGGVVPLAMSGQSDDARRYMRGTETKTPRCIALEGFIGAQVKCRIYKNRPSTCRAFRRSWEKGDGNFLCDRARSAYGLNPFSQY